MKFTMPPANRIVAFVGPYISLASGAIAGWLILKVHLLGALGIQQTALSSSISYGVTAGLGALIPHLGMQRWLTGHQAFTEHIFDFVKTLDPQIQTQIATVLPLVQGDAMKALERVLTEPALDKTPAPAIAGPVAPDPAGDGSGDADAGDPAGVTTLPPDPTPATFGDQAQHAPAGTDPPPPPLAAPPAGAEQAGGAV